MAIAVARSIIFDGSVDETNITKATEAIAVNEQEKYTSGKWVRKQVTLAAATDMDLNTYFADAFGNTVNFVTLKELWVWNTDTAKTVVVSGNILTLFQGAATETPTIQPDGWYAQVYPTGWTVVGATSDVMTLTPSAAGAVVKIFIVGAEA